MRFHDRRRDPRVSLRTRVDFTIGCREGERGLLCTDLSTSGFGAECTVPPRPGTRIGFGLRLADRHEPCRGEGEVVWVQPMLERRELRYRLAVRFTAFPAEDGSAICNEVQRRLEENDTMAFPRKVVASLTGL